MVQKEFRDLHLDFCVITVFSRYTNVMAINQSYDPRNSASAADAPDGGMGFGGVESAPAAPNALDYVSIYSTLTTTEQHEKFLDAVEKAVKKKLPSLERIQLPEPLGAQSFIATAADGAQFAVNLLFSDIIPDSPDLLPKSYKEIPAAQSLQRLRPNINLINTIMIPDRDLETRVNQTAIVLVASLVLQIDPAHRDACAKDLSVQNEFVVDNSIDAARTFIDRMSPTSLLPYFDLGFTVGVRRKTNGGWQNNSPFNKYVQDNQCQPIMAVGAMVDVKGPFPDPTTGTQKYLPIVRITAMPSLIPLTGSIFLGLVLAAQNFIQFGGWKRPFMRFSKGSPNLGNLTQDQDGSGKLWFAPDLQSMEAFIASWMFHPILCIDVASCQARIPSLYNFTDASPENQQLLMNEAVRFFGQPLAPFAGPAFSPMAKDFIGSVGPAEGIQSDSRKYTYLNQAAEGALDQDTAQVLLNFFPDPLTRARKIANLSGSFRPLYEDTIVSVSGPFLSSVSQILPSSGIKVFDPTGQGGVVPLSGFSPQFGNFTGFTPVAYQQQNRPMYGGAGLYHTL